MPLSHSFWANVDRHSKVYDPLQVPELLKDCHVGSALNLCELHMDH